ncbi:MAG: hypothetical protein EKK42_15630 [Pseudonocardiaceae bacterium]|nr:MAG: hypothetical protein EKK42_15630 [Pseudonocardiaceae bacterium]
MRKNARGSRVETTEPEPAERPDLRRYPVKRRTIDPSELTSADKIRYVRMRNLTRPPHTRWRTKNGVVDRFGNIALIYTGECQHCLKWFSVERWPATITGKWPADCSDECRSDAGALRNRRNARKMRSGETSGRRKPVHTSFDPDALGAWELAYEIVNQAPRSGRADTWATPTVWAAATACLDREEKAS